MSFRLHADVTLLAAKEPDIEASNYGRSGETWCRVTIAGVRDHGVTPEFIISLSPDELAQLVEVAMNEHPNEAVRLHGVAMAAFLRGALGPRSDR